MSERSHQTASEEGADEEMADLLVTHAPGSSPEPAPNSEGKHKQTSPLDMVFREAEVIARNLKESGTRR